MDALIQPHPLTGSIAAIPSKSMAHRLLILSALCDGITDLTAPPRSEDIDATILRCLTLLGAPRLRTRTGMRMVPITVGGARSAKLDVASRAPRCASCSPSWPRWAGATIMGHGRLAERPLSPLTSSFASMASPSRSAAASRSWSRGTLTGGTFKLPGNVSSQYVSGLLLAAPLLGRGGRGLVSEPVESRAYIDLTVSALASLWRHVTEQRSRTIGAYRVATA